MSRPVAPCGTRSAYKRGCHCGPCTNANTVYNSRRRSGVRTNLTGTGDYHPAQFDAELLAERAAVAHAWERMRARAAS